VLVTTATAEHVPIVLRGIGTVQAPNTITVKSGVDGSLVTISHVEGQWHSFIGITSGSAVGWR
jgi:hypothetical protein